jgi:predicted acylesterase/phospholipase RssA
MTTASHAVRQPEMHGGNRGQGAQAPQLAAEARIGLALSGGGFRASLFHIGVLARLAELDLLRRVEVLSTVSGGSIIGAYYYLKVKQLLEGQRNDEPGVDPYVRIVDEISRDFLEVVQKDLRTRTLLDPRKTARMLHDDYSRSDRMAGLLSHYLYGPLAGCRAPRLKDIKIHPATEPRGEVDCKAYNRVAERKIPVLILNATALNNGRSWEFTSSWIGEADEDGASRLASEPGLRLARLRFDAGDHPPERVRKLDEVTLGHAVAASACVPAVFQPLAIHDLYRQDDSEVVVQLVDGGVYDNQGLAALVASGCTHIIASDASGQLQDAMTPSARILRVVGRTMDISMARIREESVGRTHLRERGEKLVRAVRSASGTDGDEAREEAGSDGHDIPDVASSFQVREFAFLHLRQPFAGKAGRPALDPAGTSERLAYATSVLRTDLDAFSDVEAFTLMYAGYCLCDERTDADSRPELRRLAARDPSAAPSVDWNFLAIRDLLPREGPAADRKRVARLLAVGRSRVFRAIGVGGVWAWLAALVVAAPVVALVWLACQETIQVPLLFVVMAVLALAGRKLLLSIRPLGQIRPLRLIKRFLDRRSWFWLPVPFCALVSLVVLVQLAVFDRLFLRAGRVPPR